MMDEFTFTTEDWENKTSVISINSRNTSITYDSDNDRSKGQIILVIQSAISSVGSVANLTVIVVFLNHRKLRRKIPNIFIINQVRISNTTSITIHWRLEESPYVFSSQNIENVVEIYKYNYFSLCV